MLSLELLIPDLRSYHFSPEQSLSLSVRMPARHMHAGHHVSALLLSEWECCVSVL
jgi:hypothetical protein